MSKISRFIGTFIFSYLFWILFLMEDFNILKLGAQELIIGIVVSVIVSYFTNEFLVKEDGLWLFKKGRILNLIIFIPVYTWELIKANWDVAKRALSPKLNIAPSIVKISTELTSDYGVAMLSNCITLTPGTITMDLFEAENGTTMYVHCIDGTTEDTKEASDKIKGTFETYVRRIFK